MSFLNFIAAPDLSSFDTVRDVMGNQIVTRGEREQKLMISAALDGPGIIVTRVESDGRVRFSLVGKLEDRDLDAALVQVNGRLAVISGTENDRWLDFGSEETECLKSEIFSGAVGNFIFEPQLISGRVLASGLEAGVTSYVLREVLNTAEQFRYRTFFVFGAQSALGYRGLKAAAGAIQPDVALTLDLCPEEGVKLGHGPVLKLADRSLLSHEETCAAVEAAAEKAGVLLQKAVFDTTGSPGSQIFTAGGGVKTAALSLPVKRYGRLLQMVEPEDVEALVRLLLAFVC